MVNLIEPGIIGNENDIVVNSIDSPDIIYGICDGLGGLKSGADIDEIKNLIKYE